MFNMTALKRDISFTTVEYKTYNNITCYLVFLTINDCVWMYDELTYSWY